MMKATTLGALCLLIMIFPGCNRGNFRMGDAPRTETASNVPGWKEIATSGIAIQFPSTWTAIDLTRADFEVGLDKMLGNDPNKADLRNQVTAAAQRGAVKLFVFDTPTAGTGFATNCNVLIQDAPPGITLDQIAAASVQELTPLAAPGGQPKSELVQLKHVKAAFIRTEIRTANAQFPTLLTLQYMMPSGSKVAVVTFTSPVNKEREISPVARKAMDSFRFVR